MSTLMHVDDLDADPILTLHAGRRAWMFPSGRIVPEICGGEGEDDEKKFSQTDVNRMLANARRSTPEVPADYDALKAAKVELDQLKAAQGTDLDRANARITELEGKLSTAETERDTARNETGGLKILRVEDAFKSAVLTAARTTTNPEQVYALLDKSKLTIGDDGQVKGAEETVKAWLAEPANAHFVGKTTGRPAPDQGQGKGGEGKGTFGDAGRVEAQKRFPQTTPLAGAGTQQ